VVDITASTDGHVLRRSGTTLGFGQIVAAGIADGTITLVKMANIAPNSLVGNNNATSAATPAALTRSQAYSVLDIVGNIDNRIAYFTSATSIRSGSAKFSGNVLVAITLGSSLDEVFDQNTSIQFGAGAGTSPTVNSASCGGNWAVITFTTGTSPSASSEVLRFFVAGFGTAIYPMLSAGNANAAGQMTNFYVESTGTYTIILNVTSALAASTQYTLRFQFLGY
jgi:hypothetical protein